MGWTLQRAFWPIRAAAFVLIAVITLTRATSPGHRAFEVVILAVIAGLGAVWAGQDWSRREPASPSWRLVGAIGAIGFLGGLGAGFGPARSLWSFAILAALGAGSDLAFAAACGVTAAGILGLEAGGVVFGFSTSTAVGLPLLLIVCLLAGRSRRESRLRADAARALVTQMRETQQQQQRVAALDERNRIAREIHDVLAHSISALGVQIGAARAVLDDTGDVRTANRLLEQAQRLADDGLVETGRAIHALRADTPPLPDGLTSLIADDRRHHRRRAELTVTGHPRPLRPDANLALIRTAREALTNAAKHAPAVPVAVVLDYGREATTLTVSNATPPAREAVLAVGPGGGYGLAGMRERLMLIGGTLTAGNAAGRWTVQARVPQ